MVGVETTEFESVVIEAFRTALEVEDCGETTVLKGLSFEKNPVFVLGEYVSVVTCCSFSNSVPGS
jgi:hypothetical protein